MDLKTLDLRPDQSPLLAALSSEELDYLLPRLQRRSFRAGETVLAKGAPSDGLYLIASGMVSVNLREDAASGEDIATLARGECVGEMSLISGEPCSATIRALVDTDAWFIARDDFPEVLDRCPGLWRNLSGILSRRLVRTNRRLGESRTGRVTALYLLAGEGVSTPLALILGASLARQTRRRVLLLDARRGPVASLGAAADESSGRDDSAPGLGELRDVGVAGGSLCLATLAAKPGAAPAGMAAMADELAERFHEIVLLCDSPEPAAGPLLARAAQFLVVAEDGRLGEAASVAESHRGRQERLEVAALTDLAVTSDNKVGGLWDRSVLQRRARIEGLLKLVPTGGRLRLLPGDHGLLSRVREQGLEGWAADAEGPFVQACDRLARRIGRIEVGVALGAGMAKGFAHLGVLRTLMEHGVPVDYLAGSSIGSIVASTYAGGMELAQLEALMTGADRRFVKLTLPIRSISSNRGLKKILTTCHPRAPDAEFSELFIPFAAVATDVASGREVVLDEAVIWKAVLASISMPGVFPAVEHDGRVLVDGGLTNPVPGKTVRQMGADVVVAVDLASSARDDSVPGEGARVPNIIEALWRTMEIMLGEITARSAASADVTIRPHTGRSHIRDFSRRGRDFMVAGETATLAALPEIAALIPSVEVLS
ncbi:MAG TPA: patatin-like phospholipase family protein [Dehalococcoidia bacterium]|nr:patatin-like phospholipase family protein [Dehalococcoidia bacterium]